MSLLAPLNSANALHMLYQQVQSSSYAYTGQSMRDMEAVAVATSQHEPVLLVGETGTGKTTLVQQIALLVCIMDHMIMI